MALDAFYLATAIEAALAAGRIHRRYFREQPGIRKKGPIDLVTAADLEAEAEIRRLIGARCPGHTILGEEGGQANAGLSEGPRWIVDPLDGTTNFAHGLALFCVSIALEVRGVVELGVVYDPMAGELFTAERGRGARRNGRPIAVTSCERLIDALLCTGFPYSMRTNRRHQVEVFAGFLGRARAVRRLGSAALDLCYVAAGRFDGFWETDLHAWDVAAGALIVAEARGAVSDFSGQPVDLFGGQIVASNGRLHNLMLQVIARPQPEPMA